MNIFYSEQQWHDLRDPCERCEKHPQAVRHGGKLLCGWCYLEQERTKPTEIKRG